MRVAVTLYGGEQLHAMHASLYLAGASFLCLCLPGLAWRRGAQVPFGCAACVRVRLGYLFCGSCGLLKRTPPAGTGRRYSMHDADGTDRGDAPYAGERLRWRLAVQPVGDVLSRLRAFPRRASAIAASYLLRRRWA